MHGETLKLLPDMSPFCSRVSEIMLWRRTLAEESDAYLVNSGRNITDWLGFTVVISVRFSAFVSTKNMERLV